MSDIRRAVFLISSSIVRVSSFALLFLNASLTPELATGLSVVHYSVFKRESLKNKIAYNRFGSHASFV